MEKIQYISQGATLLQHRNNIIGVLEAGGKWIQLRCKCVDKDELLLFAIDIRLICDQYDAVFIINDYVDIAVAADADGVHLGLLDADVTEARKILGYNRIIGGTANNIDDVMNNIKDGCDYIGLGPLHYTETKKNLSPILGIDGVRDVMAQLKLQSLKKKPIYVIGGVVEKDIRDLCEVGVYGIALSSSLTLSPESFIYFNQLITS